MNRAQTIESLLGALHPSYLEIIDDSEKHKGHAGAKGGAQHFTVRIAAPCFLGLTRVAQHRLIYDKLSHLIPHAIHALQIEIIPTQNQ